MSNKVKFTVGGISYAISSSDSEQYIHNLARELDQTMDQIAKQSPFLSTTMVAVLAAMDAADSRKKTEQKMEELRDELNEMTQRAAVARSDADRAMRAFEEYKQLEQKPKA